MALDRKSRSVIAELQVAVEKIQWAKTSLKTGDANETENVDALLADVEAGVRRAREAWQS